MKTIKSALIGTKSLPDTNYNDELRRILREHRTVILTRLLNELPTYLDYKFHSKPSKATMDSIKERLLSLKDSYVSLENYNNTVTMIETRQLSVLSGEEFYGEINAEIKLFIKVQQLDLVA
jgi:hypothetical protein